MAGRLLITGLITESKNRPNIGSYTQWQKLINSFYHPLSESGPPNPNLPLPRLFIAS